MLKIGLTGGIGSGKTSVAGIFHVLGIPVFDADRQARLIMETDGTLVSAIKTLFGSEAYTGQKLNRKYIASIVFNDEAKLTKLNALTHPAAIAAATTWMNTQNAPYVVKEAALLFESGSAAGLDYIIGVSAPIEIRMQRVMHRDTLTRSEVLTRISRQMDEDEKMKRCDYVIFNDDRQLVLSQVLALHEQLLIKASAMQPDALAQA